MPPFSIRRLLWAGPAVTAAATLLNILYFSVTRALYGQYLIPLGENSSQLSPMPLLMPVLATLVPGLLAAILFGFLIRIARRPITIFLSVCVAALVLSLGGPFNLPDAPMQTKILLSGMHVIAAMVISGGILLSCKAR